MNNRYLRYACLWCQHLLPLQLQGDGLDLNSSILNLLSQEKKAKWHCLYSGLDMGVTCVLNSHLGEHQGGTRKTYFGALQRTRGGPVSVLTTSLEVGMWIDLQHLCQLGLPTWHKLESFGRRELQLRRFFHQTGLEACLFGIFLECQLMCKAVCAVPPLGRRSWEGEECC